MSYLTLTNITGALFIISLLTYLIPSILLKFYGAQNLKKKYALGAESWALVTGGSSGIGKAIVKKLAEQKINCIIASYPDKLLEESTIELKKEFSDVKFISIGVDLSTPDFMDDIKEQTDDKEVQLVFSNAGYITTGFFAQTPLEVQLANHNVNATASIYITHHFVNQMQAKKLRGCIGYTSSPAGFMPCPFSSMYGSTKAWLTEFAMSIAPEIKSDGIDVCVVHPSPIESNFYQGTHALNALEFFKSTATGPETIANVLFSCMGRSIVRDHGYYPAVVRILLKILDVNLLADIIARVAPAMGDFKAMKDKEL